MNKTFKASTGLAFTPEKDPASDYVDIFRAGGWSPVLSMGDIHIFKAEPGTPPVHTAEESWREELQRQRDQYARYSGVTVAVWVLFFLGLRWAGVETWVKFAALFVVFIPVVYTVMPLLGYTRRLHASRRRA